MTSDSQSEGRMEIHGMWMDGMWRCNQHAGQREDEVEEEEEAGLVDETKQTIHHQKRHTSSAHIIIIISAHIIIITHHYHPLLLSLSTHWHSNVKQTSNRTELENFTYI